MKIKKIKNHTNKRHSNYVHDNHAKDVLLGFEANEIPYQISIA